LPSAEKESYTGWDDWNSHPRQVVLDWAPRTVRTAVHFFDTTDSLHHWDRDYATKYASVLVRAASDHFGRNAKMNLPADNDTDVLDANIKLDLDLSNVYFHYTDEDCFFIKKGKNSNRYDRKMGRTYVNGDESMIHIFIMPFHPDELKSGRQKLESTGIALGNTIKLAGIYEQKKAAWDNAGLLAHEVGHVLGLRHTWNGGDGCKDTPHNSNCWNTSDKPPCEGITSNNLMDYNATQAAITPCQINTMHTNMANPGRLASRLVAPLSCTNKKSVSWTINSKQKWDQAIALPGDIVIEKGGELCISSYVSTASDTKIIVKKGGILLLDGALIAPRCDSSEPSIIIHKGGKVHSREKTTVLTGNPLH